MTWIRRGVRLLVVLALLAAGYVAVAALESRRGVALPDPPGAGPVGRETFVWTEAGHLDPLAGAGSVRDRSLSTWIWYPAAPGAPQRAAAYAPGGWGRLHLPGLVGLGQTRFEAIRPRARTGARPAPGPRHLVVLSPGLGLSVVQYQSLAEALASHGYVVAGFTPTGSANLTVLGRRTVRQTARGSLPDASLYRPDVRAAALRLLTTWVADARFVAGRARVAITGLRLAPGVIYAGHSFGGAASLEACREDRTCTGAANLDGLDIGPVSRTGLATPMLLLGHANSCVTALCTPNGADDRRDRSVARRLVHAGSGPAWSVDIGHTEHFDFTDYAAYRLAFPLRHLLPLGSRPGGESLLVGEECLLDFADRATGQRPRWGCLDGRLGDTRVHTWREH